MKSKKRAIIASLIISICSFIIYTILNFVEFNVDANIIIYFSNIFLGTFTGSILSLIIYSTEYSTVKMETLENYYIVALNFSKHFLNLEYIYIEEPIKLIYGYYNELRNNKLNSHMNEQLMEAYRNQSLSNDEIENNLLPMEEEEKLKLLEYYKSTAPQWIKDELTNDVELDNYLENELNERIKEYDELINCVMKQYVKISEQDYSEVENAYGQIDFMIANKSWKITIYNKLHIKQREILKFIKVKAWHFKNYYDSRDGNKIVMLEFIMEIQKRIFCIDEKSNLVAVYNNYKYNIDCELECLRTKIYGVKPIYTLPLKDNYKSFSLIKNNKQQSL